MDGSFESSGVSTLEPLTRELIHDTCGFPEMHALYLERETKGYMVSSGRGTSWYDYSSVPTEFVTVPTYSSMEDTDTFATRAAARTNPGKPHIQLPVFIFELKDLPKMIHEAGLTLLGKFPGKSAAGKAGSAYLSWQFGWKPLLKDLTDLVTFADAVEQRKKVLRDLVSKGGYSRKYSMPSGGGGGSNNYDLTLSLWPWCKVRVTSTTTVKRWAKPRWVPQLPPGLTGDDRALTSYARKSIFALHPQQITLNVWEALPWSWLVDYFTNIGDVLSATDNSVAVLASDLICVMTHTTTVGTAAVIEYDNYPGVFDYTRVFSLGGAGKIEKKERTLASLSAFKTSMPILNNGQLGILAALGAQRFGHRL